MELNRSHFDLNKCRNSIGIKQSKLNLNKKFIRQFLLGQYKLEVRLSCGYTTIGILRVTILYVINEFDLWSLKKWYGLD